MTKQLLILSLILLPFLISSCKGQNSTNQSSTIDTVSLFNPKNEIKETLPKSNFTFAKNSMIIFSNNSYGFRINNESFETIKYDSLLKLFNNNQTQILSERFYIYIDSSINFNDVFNIIKSLKDYGVENYRVINSQSYFHETQTLSSIAIPVKNYSPVIDSTYLLLKFRDTRIILTFLNIDTTFQTVNDLDSFFLNNKTKILNEKIMLDLGINSSREVYKSTIAILRKYNFSKFSIKSDNSD